MRPGTVKRAPLRVGLTGGIASGKSMVAAHFARLGVRLIDADLVARELVAPGQPLLARLVEAFGADLLNASGALDRAELRRRVFDSPAELEKLEALMHPPILAAMVAAAEAASGDYLLMIIPLLVETAAQSLVDRVLVVDCSAAEQIERLMRRDGIDQRLAERMLAAQASREERLALADDVLVNSGSPDELGPKVAELDRFYRRLARSADSGRSGHIRLP